MNIKKILAALSVVAALPLAIHNAYGSADDAIHHDAIPNAPQITEAEFAKGSQIFFQRCAGCHGVLRKGATGKPLTPNLTIDKGTEYLKTFIGYGSPGGMPNFGSSGELTEAEVDLMARYIQQTPVAPPEMSLKDMEATWKVIVPVNKRPTKKMNKANL